MKCSAAILDKARRLEQLLRRVEVGESLGDVNEELGFKLDQKQFARWQAKYEAGGRKWEALIDGRQGHPREATEEIREWLYARKKEDEELRAPQLAHEIAQKFEVELSDGHINYLLRKRGLSADVGRPPKPSAATETEEGQAKATVASESTDNAGIFFPGSSQSGDGTG